MYILLLLSSLFNAQPAITIVVDDSISSKILKQDLECDFNRVPLGYIDYEKIRYLSYIQESIVENSNIIHYTEISKLGNSKMIGLTKYPAIRVHRYRDVVFLNDILYERSYSLLAIKYHIDTHYRSDEFSKWERICKAIRSVEDRDHANEILTYMLSANILEDLPDIFPYYGDIPSAEHNTEKSIRMATRKYGKRKGFPKRKLLEYPPKPQNLTIKPWEEGYRFTGFPDLNK